MYKFKGAISRDLNLGATQRVQSKTRSVRAARRDVAQHQLVALVQLAEIHRILLPIQMKVTRTKPEAHLRHEELVQLQRARHELLGNLTVLRAAR